ncbi:MAG: hypothetical protein ACJAWL_001492 [Motiliproteus sp.]
MARTSPLIENGWQQWSLIGRDQLPDWLVWHINSKGGNECQLFIVVTQTCCIANESYRDEPWLELIGGVLLDQPPHQRLIGGYSPRELHVPILNSVHADAGTLELKMRYRFQLPREHFGLFSPSAHHHVSERYKHNLRAWMTSRYCRPAFPDNFADRLSKFSDKLAEKLSKYSAKYPDDLIMVLVTHSPDTELPDDENYQCEWKLVHSQDITTEQEKEIRVIEKSFSDRIEGVAGINGSFVAFDETEVSIAELRAGERWFFDYLTYRGKTVGAAVDNGQC